MHYELSLQPHLDELAKRARSKLKPLPSSKNSLRRHIDSVRHELKNVLGLNQHRAPKVIVRSSPLRSRKGFHECSMELRVDEGVTIPLNLLIPNSKPPYNVVVAFHGHDANVDDLVGRFSSSAERKKQLLNHSNFAQALAEAGYMVAAVESRGFRRRLLKIVDAPFFKGDPMKRSCRQLAFEYQAYGRTLAGERVWDGMQVLSYLRSRRDVNASCLGVTGHSGGGTVALLLSIVDPSVSCAVISGYLSSLRKSIFGMWHCECNYIPNILSLGELGDISAALAPRPVRFIAGAQDKIFPFASTRAEFAKVQRTYDILGCGDECSLKVHPDGHRYDIPLALEWFTEKLRIREDSIV